MEPIKGDRRLREVGLDPAMKAWAMSQQISVSCPNCFPRALDPGHPGVSARRAAPELQMLLDLKVLGMHL